MKSLFSQSLLLTALICTVASLYAVREFERERYYREDRQEGSCCISWLWENVGFEVKGGVVPILWTNRGNPLCDDCTTTNTTAVNPGKFLKAFKVPWTVGAEVQWSADCNRVYLDFQYRQAKGKNDNNVCSFLFDADSENFLFNTYRTYSVYVGADHFFAHDWVCNDLSAFLGIKVGFTHQSDLTLTVTSVDFATPTTNCFARRNVLSGGGRVGVEYANLCNCVTVNLTVEFLGQAGPRFGNLALPNNLIAAPAVLNAVASEVLFPVTLGFRYNF